MKFIRQSDLGEYSCQFWMRQAAKGDRPDIDAMIAFGDWANPIELLEMRHPNKLPFASTSANVIVVILDRVDVAGLVVAPHLATPEWMGEPKEGLNYVPNPCPRRLDELARLHIEDGYFAREGPGTPRKLYLKWKQAGSLDGRLGPGCRPLVKQMPTGELEIADGWGRLLAYEALLQEDQEDYAFSPVECFVARDVMTTKPQ